MGFFRSLMIWLKFVYGVIFGILIGFGLLIGLEITSEWWFGLNGH